MLKIGSLTLDNPVILAPMAGVSDQPFRRLVRRFGAGLAVSEMIASNAMVRAHWKTMRMSGTEGEAGPIAIQIAGGDPQTMAEAARMNADRGADIIDINMGCPAKKVVKGVAGAALMKDEILAGQIIAAVVRAVDVPVTVKMRLGWDEDSINAPQLARIAQDCGAAMVTVHGRTRGQFYRGEADWRAIGAVKRAVSIPVVGNGDVNSLADAKALLDQSGADGVMIGRGSYGRPWFPGQVATFLASGTAPSDPPLSQRCAILVEHVATMIERYGVKAGIPMARKHVAWYACGLAGAAQFRDRVMHAETPERLFSVINAYFDPLIDRQAAA